jgi:hypothetical protein
MRDHLAQVAMLLAVGAIGMGLGGGCKSSTEALRLFDDVSVGEVLTGRMAVNRHATHSRFGMTRVLRESKPTANFERLEVYRIALAHNRVVAKDYIFRQGSLTAGDARVRYRRILEVEVPESAFNPMPSTWEPIGRAAVLPVVAAAIEDATDERAYPHRRLALEDFVDLRNFYFDELASRAYARSLAAALAGQSAAAMDLPDDPDAMQRRLEAQARQYSLKLAANQREIQITEEQLIRVNYNYEFAKDPAEKQRWLAIKEGLQAKIATLNRANEQIEQLIQASARQENPTLAMARWKAGHQLASQRSHRVLQTMRGNVGGFVLSMADLLERLPSEPVPDAEVWAGQAWSDLWPQHDLVTALQGSGLDKLAELDRVRREQSHQTTLPSGVVVKTTQLQGRRIRVEISFEFYRFPVLGLAEDEAEIPQD